MNIDLKIQEIKDTLRSGAVLDPTIYAEYHRILAGQYAFLSDEFGKIEIEKNIYTSEKKDEVKSDAQAEIMFLATEKGQEYIKTRLELKAIEKLMSSLNKSIEVAKIEYASSNN